jgi:MoaA/NifB/PqqE/SkfB family radical SAM enzyme
MTKFPINTATGCQLKWTWSTLWLTSGTTASCHRIMPDKISLENFQNFHNTPKKIADRELMLKGEWPTGGCEYCQTIEEAGGKSDRQHHLDWDQITPHELETNPVATVVTPKIVEVFMNNTCNLKCVYCDPGLSSSIQKENNEFGNFNEDGVFIPAFNPVISNRNQYVEEFFKWLENNYMHLERFHLLGGEPFIQPEIDRFLEFWETHHNPNVVINIISNLMIKERTLQKYIDKLSYLIENKYIGDSHITGSLDTWGSAAEYARNGLKLETFENNLLYILKSNIKHAGIYSVITSLTLMDMPKLLDKVREWRAINPDFIFGFQYNTMPARDFLHPRHLGAELWQNTFTEIFQKLGNRDQVEEMHGIKAVIDTGQFDRKEINKLHIYLDELDRRRGTNWREVYPYLNI